jgi:hypothetical protein
LKVIADVVVDMILPTVVEKVFGPRQIVETEFRIGIQRNLFMVNLQATIWTLTVSISKDAIVASDDAEKSSDENPRKESWVRALSRAGQEGQFTPPATSQLLLQHPTPTATGKVPA